MKWNKLVFNISRSGSVPRPMDLKRQLHHPSLESFAKSYGIPFRFSSMDTVPAGYNTFHFKGRIQLFWILSRIPSWKVGNKQKRDSIYQHPHFPKDIWMVIVENRMWGSAFILDKIRWAVGALRIKMFTTDVHIPSAWWGREGATDSPWALWPFPTLGGQNSLYHVTCLEFSNYAAVLRGCHYQTDSI